MDATRTNERTIARKVIAALTAAGHECHVDYDRGFGDSEANTKDDSVDAMLDALFAVDEVHLMIDPRDGSYAAFVWFIWGNGNDGLDCITDYSCSLEQTLRAVCDWIERKEAA